MDFNMLHPAEQIVMIMERIYSYGMTTTSGGNLSIMDNEGVMWITPSGIDKGSLRADDIMRVLPNGEIQGNHTPSVEYPFHRRIYEMRPDIKAVLHAHPPALVSISLARQMPNMNLIPDAGLICGKVGIAAYGLPGSVKLGENIAEVFEKGINTVMMENHGVVIGANSLFKAFIMFETLDYTSRVQIKASSIGNIRNLSDKHMQIYSKKVSVFYEELPNNIYTSKELGLRRDMCTLIKRAYKNKLFTSGQGTFSCRVDGNTFVITPYAKDRQYLEPDDLVKISDCKKEAGKSPSRSAMLHNEIYRKHPEINSIIVAHPPNIMAFAVTDASFDARLIPESYIMLKNVRKFPFGSSVLQPEMTADEISIKNPVCIIENDCVITAGTTLINAFDRLEVLEYSAKSVIYSKNIGDIVKISEEEVEEIEVAFNL